MDGWIGLDRVRCRAPYGAHEPNLWFLVGRLLTPKLKKLLPYIGLVNRASVAAAVEHVVG